MPRNSSSAPSSYAFDIAGLQLAARHLEIVMRLEVHPELWAIRSFRKLRGPTYVAVIADELAFWFTEAAYANPDVEVLAAVRPALLTTRGPLILASSPYAKTGVLWNTFRRHYGPGGAADILVARGASRDFNPTIPQSEVDRALEADRVRNTAEFLAEFRSDVKGFAALEAVEACTGDYRERLPAANNFYKAFTDPSGGSDDSLRWRSRTSPRTRLSSMRFARPARRFLLMRWSMTSRRC